jgi:hypothetical protein
MLKAMTRRYCLVFVKIFFFFFQNKCQVVCNDENWNVMVTITMGFLWEFLCVYTGAYSSGFVDVDTYFIINLKYKLLRYSL